MDRIQLGNLIQSSVKKYPCLKTVMIDDCFFSSEKINKIMGEDFCSIGDLITVDKTNAILDKLLGE